MGHLYQIHTLCKCYGVPGLCLLVTGGAPNGVVKLWHLVLYFHASDFSETTRALPLLYIYYLHIYYVHYSLTSGFKVDYHHNEISPSAIFVEV